VAQQDSGLKQSRSSVRAVIFFAWVMFSTVLYGMAVVLVSPFSRSATRWLGRKWCRQQLAVAGIDVTVTGDEQLSPDGRYIVIANHASHLDIPILMAAFPVDLYFMAKKELFRIPFFGWGIRAMGHIAVDRTNARSARKAISHAVEQIHRKRISVVLFPEGTRTPNGEIGPFKQASFALPVEAGMPVLPVYIDGTFTALPKKTLAIQPAHVTIRIAPPVPADTVAAADRKELAGIVRDTIVKMKKGVA
jgi:1-acyl-sn-glycerol-3-phosphate acyltransferase